MIFFMLLKYRRSIIMLSSLIPEKILGIAALICTPVLCAVLLKLFSRFLPKDKGREFAVDGSKSTGKIRGAGLAFICVFIICSLLFVPVTLEYGIYYALIFAEMLSGYLDDRADKPWNEYKKGLLDLLISAAASVCFVYFNKALTSISFFGLTLRIPAVVFVIICTILIWMLINAVNCSDGIDGFSSVLTSISYISAALVIYLKGGDRNFISLTALMILVLLPYLWKNSEPSTMLMGDAGSRALGIFLALAIMKTGNILLVIPLCFVICLDGLLGIAKVSIIRFLHLNVMKNIRTPLHDHFRKNKGNSNSQVIYRFCIAQIIISAVTLFALKA